MYNSGVGTAKISNFHPLAPPALAKGRRAISSQIDNKGKFWLGTARISNFHPLAPPALTKGRRVVSTQNEREHNNGRMPTC